MKKNISVLLLLTLPLMFLYADLSAIKKQKTIQKNIEAIDLEVLSVINEFGDVDIKTRTDEIVTIVATVATRAKTELEATNLLNDIIVEISTVEKEIIILTKVTRARVENMSYKIYLDITIPERMAVNVQNNFGDISVTGTKGKVNIENFTGNLSVRDLNESILKNEFGNITVIGNQGDLEIKNSNGNTFVENIIGATTINTRFSDINLKRIASDLVIISRKGNITISEVRDTYIECSFGDIFLKNQKGRLKIDAHNSKINASDIVGNTDINNSFGEVNISQAEGYLNINAQNSDVSVESILDDVIIENMFGKIEAKNITGDFTAKNINGEIIAEDIVGDIDITNQFGLISSKNIGGNVNSSNSNGSVVLSEIGGIIEVNTTFGDIILDNISPLINCENSNGSVLIRNIREGIPDIEIRTSFSDVNLKLSKTISAVIQLATSFGNISSKQISGDLRTNSDMKNFNGIINDGKGKIYCSGSNTDFSIELIN